MGNPKPVPKFQKGNKLGKGRPPIPPEVKAARKFNKSEFELSVNRIFFLSVDKLRELISKEGLKTTTVMDAIIARIALKGIEKGTTDELNYFMERLVGKVADNLNVNDNSGHGALMAFIAGANKIHAQKENGEK